MCVCVCACMHAANVCEISWTTNFLTQKKLKRKTWFDDLDFFLFQRRLWTLAHVNPGEYGLFSGIVHFYKNVLDLSNLILITETEQRDLSIWFWWTWSACTLKEKLSGKDWKFLLRKSKSNTVFQYPILVCYKWPWRLYSTSSTYFLHYSIMALCFILGYI